MTHGKRGPAHPERKETARYLLSRGLDAIDQAPDPVRMAELAAPLDATVAGAVASGFGFPDGSEEIPEGSLFGSTSEPPEASAEGGLFHDLAGFQLAHELAHGEEGRWGSGLRRHQLFGGVSDGV